LPNENNHSILDLLFFYMTEFKVLYIDYPKVEIIYSSLDKYKENNRLKRRYISSNREEFD
jgi:hypothetical protein